MNLFAATLNRQSGRRTDVEIGPLDHGTMDDSIHIPPATDHELLTLWLEYKETSALEAIILRHGPLVRSLSSRLLRSPHEQADAFQTVFLVVSQNASRIRHRESLASWIYGVTVRTCLMFSRQRSHEPIPEDAEAPMFPRPEVLEHQELVLTLNKELDLLPAHLRESLVLVYLEGHSRRSAADLTNTTEQTIKSRLARGRNLLRSRLLKRGVTFSTAFTIFSVTTTSDAANLTISDQLLLRTIDTCQTGQLPLSFPAVPLDPIAIVPTGAPMISSTTVYSGLAVATLLLLTTLGIGNHGRADGPAQQAGVNTAVSDDMEIGNELAATIMVDEPPAATQFDESNPTSGFIPAVAAATPQVTESLSTPKRAQSEQSSSEQVKNASRSMELQLLELEIEMLKGSISISEAIVERAKNEPEFLNSSIGYFGAFPEVLQSKSHDEKLQYFISLGQPNLETSKQQLAQAQQRQLELIAKSVPEPQEHALAEIEVRRLDSLISQKKELYERMLLAKLYHRNGALPPDSVIDNRITSLDPEKTNELKFEILKLAIEKQQAEQALLSIQNREATQPHLSFVGSAVRTVEPPTTPNSPPAVADADLSRNPTPSQPAADMPPIKQHEQSLLDLKVERAEMREKNARELAESGSGLASSSDLKLRLMDAKIALQEALLERERFRVRQDLTSQFSESPTPPLAEVKLPEHAQITVVDIYPVDPQGNHLSTTPVLTLDDMETAEMLGAGMASFAVSASSMQKFSDVLTKFPTAQFVIQTGGKNYLTRVIPGGLGTIEEVPQADLDHVRDQFNRMSIIKGAEERSRLVPSSTSHSPQPAKNDPASKLSIHDTTAPRAENAIDPARQSELVQLKNRYRLLVEEYRRYRPELLNKKSEAFFQNTISASETDNTENNEKIVSYLEAELQKIESQVNEQTAVELSDLRKKVLEYIHIQIIAAIRRLESNMVNIEIEMLKDPSQGHQLEHYQKALEFARQQLADINEELKESSFTATDSRVSKSSSTVESNQTRQTSLANFYFVDQEGKSTSSVPVLNIDDFKGVNLGGNGEITFVVDKLARPKIQEVLKQHLGHRFIALIGNKEYPVDVTANAWIVTSTVTHSDAKQILAYFDGRGVGAKNAELSSERLDSAAQSPISNDKLTIRLSSEVPMTAIFKDPADPAKEVKLDINDGRSSNVLGEFPRTRTEIVFQTKSQTSEETFSFPVVLEFRDGIDFSKIPSFFNSVQIDLTQSDYELLRQSRLEVYLYTVERPGRKQIGENGQFVDGPNTTMCIAFPRGRADNARLSDEAFRKVVESKKTIFATLRSAALASTKPQRENSLTPPPTNSEPGATSKTLGVRFSNDFNAKLTFDKLVLPEANMASFQQIPVGTHPVTLTYNSSDSNQAFSQSLVLEVLSDINELDLGDLSGEFRLTLGNLGIMQQGGFGQALVAYDVSNNRINASGRVGSGATVSPINTILDLETIRSKAKAFSSSRSRFNETAQRTGKIVALLYSPEYEQQSKFRHTFYAPGRPRVGFGGTFSQTDWTLLTPDGIPEAGAVVELFKVNADAAKLEELQIEPFNEQYNIDNVNAADIYLSPHSAEGRSLTVPITQMIVMQRMDVKYLIMAPKGKYTPETLSTEIWNKLHPPAKN